MWYFQSEGRCETVRRVMPSSAAGHQVFNKAALSSRRRNICTRGVVVESLLDREGDGARALVEDRVLHNEGAAGQQLDSSRLPGQGEAERKQCAPSGSGRTTSP